MKPVKKTIAIVAVILLLVVGFVCLQPVYDAAAVVFHEKKADVLRQIEQTFGLSVSVGTMSPSILSSLRLSRIDVADARTGEKLVSVKKIRFRYRISRLLLRDFEHAFDGLLLSGVGIRYDMKKDSESARKIAAFAASLRKNNSAENTVSFAAPERHISLPFPIRIKNLSAELRADSCALLLRCGSVYAGPVRQSPDFPRFSDENCIYAETSGRFSFIPDTGAFDGIGNAQCDFSVKTLITPNLNESTARFSVNYLENKDFTIVPFDVIGKYNADALVFRVFFEDAPFGAECVLNTEKKRAEISMRAEQFYPFSVAAVKKRNHPANLFRDSVISGNYGLSIAKNADGSAAVRYRADGNFLFPGAKKIPSARAVYNFSGTEKNISIASLAAESDAAKLSFSGSVNIPQMQLQGILAVEKLTLPNGNTLQTSVFLDPLDKGFMGFIPELHLKDKTLTALQLEVVPNDGSVDCSLEMSDYSHPAFGEPGKVLLRGSFVPDKKNRFVQAQAEIQNMFLDSLIDAASFFVGGKTAANLSRKAARMAPYIMSGDLYASSDFRSVLYNVPVVFIANTEKDAEMLILSFDGNETALQVSRCDILYARQSVNIALQTDFSPDYRDAFFSGSVSVNSIPYSLSGSVVGGKSISVAGNYGFDLTAELDGEDRVSGSFRVEALPFYAGKYVLAFSADSSFRFNSAEDWSAAFSRLELTEVSEYFSLEPVFSCRGTADPFGCMFEDIVYSDAVSLVNGTGSVMWQFSPSCFESASAVFSLSDGSVHEKYNLDVSAANPEKKTFKETDWLRDIYTVVHFSAEKSPSARFFKRQSAENTISAEITALGTIGNPALTAAISDSSVAFGKNALEFRAALALEDGFVTVSDASCAYAGQKLLNPELSFYLRDFSGMFSAQFEGHAGKSAVSAPITLQCSAALPEKTSVMPFSVREIAVPSDISFTLTLPHVIYGESAFAGPYTCSVNKSAERLDISALDEQVSGFCLADGLVMLRADPSLPVSFLLAGSIAEGVFDISVEDVAVDLSILDTLLKTPYAAISGGTAAGKFRLDGVFSDPEFSGKLTAKNVLFTCPEYITEIVRAPVIEIIAEKNRIYFKETRLNSVSHSGAVSVALELLLDSWSFESLQLWIETLDNTFLKARVNIPHLQVLADGGCNLHIAVEPETVFVTGAVFAENAEGTISPGLSPDDDKVKESVMSSVLDLAVTIGQHGTVYFPTRNNPIIRALVAPQTPVFVKLDTAADTIDLQGDLVLRGGQISYLRRNFIMREGRLVLKERTMELDPRITVRAEMRERDTDGNLVRIILSALNQPLSEFSPHFSAEPAKSENEIMTMLGENISDNFAGGAFGQQIIAGLLDYGIQTTVLRRVENGLREKLNLDIFSMRTTILQNAMKQYFDTDSRSDKISFSNFIDDSTVYIGKYFRNTLYADALLHLLYDESRQKNDSNKYGLYLQPEIGFEMESPFATIRWNIAPETSIGESCWIPYTSISLSWKFSF
ncbi:MAG: translocation/assembly module TamB domain-containing protein [Bacteroides sp.]|nr:translocation/assembly module TamB domain-containing protein [Prevotella sp.]MCM1408156.1 translocation/assembly module TamB domain-containing protein [Treponema brennaborense]MCM1469480.1 translocation/assembly module TamB domain-containing protein [Bacteroides sp.]